MAKNYNYDSVISSIDKDESLLNCSKAINEFRLTLEPLSSQVQGTKAGEGIDKKYNDIMDLTSRMYAALDLMQQAMASMKSSAEYDKKTFEEEQAAAAAAAAAARSASSSQGSTSYTSASSSTTTSVTRTNPTSYSKPSGGNGGYSNYF